MKVKIVLKKTEMEKGNTMKELREMKRNCIQYLTRFDKNLYQNETVVKSLKGENYAK